MSLSDSRSELAMSTTGIWNGLDKDQNVPKKIHSQQSERLNKVDPKWKYNITLGDLEFRKITHYDGTEETLWFPMEEYPKDYADPGEKPAKDGDDKKKKKKGKKRHHQEKYLLH